MSKLIKTLIELENTLDKCGAVDAADKLTDVIKDVVRLSNEGGPRIESRIKHRGGRYLVFNRAGKLKGIHKTRQQASRHLKTLDQKELP